MSRLLPLLLLLIFPLRADLVAHYPLDDTGPSTLVTDSFANNHGTEIGSATPTKGITAPHGTAYDLPLRSGFHIEPSPQVQPTDQFTISFWFRPTTLDQFDRLFETLAGTGNDGSGIRIDLGSAPGNQVRVLIRDGNGTTNTTLTSPLTLTIGNWYFCALRYDSVNSSCQLTLLQDTNGTITPDTISTSTDTLTSLGTNAIQHNTGVFIAADDANAAGSNDFGGAIDDLAIFQTRDTFGVLTDAELAEVYNIGALAFDPPAPRPTINSFTANGTNFNSGDTVTLNWNVTDADTVEIFPGIGSVSPIDSLTFTAAFTEVYTLTAINAEGSTTSSLQITIDGQTLPPRLNEFLASNSSFDDGDGNSTDWIEIHNRNLFPLDISGYHLTDDPTNPTQWTFPNGTTLAANQHLLVFASSNDTPDSAGNLHTNFSLSANGEYLALTEPSGIVIQEFAPTYPPQRTDISFATDGFRTPTPRAQNTGTPMQGFVIDTSFDVDRGHFTAPFNLTITSPTTNAEIYYTTDGTNPNPTNGTLFTGPLTISATTVLRAAAFRDNFFPTDTDTQSYIFLNDIITQGNTPPNTTTLWAGRIADYEMDPDIVTSPAYSTDIIPALQEFATLSLTLDPDDFYGPQGIYQNPESEGSAWERPVSAELISHDGSESGFQIDAGIRIQGGSSRNPDTPKHSLSLRFRNIYGAGTLDYPLFRDSPDGRNAVERFDTLQLRSNYNHGFSHRHFWQTDKAQYNRDQFANDTFMALGNTGIHGRWTHLYINGTYWGLYHVHERADQDFMESYFGGEDDDYDAINAGTAQSGTINAYSAMVTASRTNIATPTAFEGLRDHLNIESFIDYMLLNFFFGNNDWDFNNWRAAGTGPTGIPFHFFPWDSEFAISPPRTNPAFLDIANSLNINATGRNNRNNRPSGIHQDLAENAEYRLQFADRAHAALFNNGPLSPTGADATWRIRSQQMDLAVIAESARWGDYRRDVEAAGGWVQADYQLYTKTDHYLPTQDYILGTYFPLRPDIFLDQLRSRNLYPQVDAPVYTQDASSTLTMTNPNPGGTIFYTIDGTDPRDPSAITYTGPITLTTSATYDSRILENGLWSALQSADITNGTPADATNLVTSELHYNEPGATEENEFIEFTNISTLEINLSNLTFTAGLTYTFPLGTTLAPGAQLTVTAAQYEGSLDNGGETITLVDASGTIIESFTYNDRAPWPEASDGDGFSLVRISPASQLDPNLPTSWRPSTTLGGNPGDTDSTTFPSGDLIAYALQGQALTVDQNSLIVPHNLATDDIIQTIETSTDLITWTTLPTPTSQSLPNSGFIQQTFSVSPITQKRFYRLRVTLR